LFIHSTVAGGTASSLLGDLVAWWSLDESGGNSRADSHGANTLNETDGPISTGTLVQGSAADFDGVTQKVSTTTHVVDVSGSFTVAAWINPGSITGDSKSIVAQGSNTNSAGQFALQLSPTAARFIVSDGAFKIATHGSAISTATKYFLIGYYDVVSQEIGISVNNTAFVTTAFTGTVNADSGDGFAIGGWNAGPTRPYQGLVDEAAAWNRLLTSDERVELYNAGSGIAYPG
jgi:hypothetical protein